MTKIFDVNMQTKPYALKTVATRMNINSTIDIVYSMSTLRLKTQYIDQN